MLYNRYTLYGIKVVDNITKKEYKFKTEAYTETFYNILQKWERSKVDNQYSIASLEGGITLSQSNIVPSSFSFIIGSDEYRFDLSKKPSIVMRLVLRLLGFKKQANMN